MRWFLQVVCAVRAPVLLLALGTVPPAAASADWPMYGRDATHNAVSPEANPPTRWDAGDFEHKTGEWKRESSRNIRWAAQLGTNTFGDPVVANGLVWIGTSNGCGTNVPDASVLTCFRESDGRLLYRYVSPRLPGGRAHDWPCSALNCSPLIEGDRMWFTTNRCEVVCMDIGPLRRGEPQPQESWRLDMMQKLGVFPRAPSMGLAHLCSIASYRDLIYVITGNGVNEASTKINAPEAPSLICLKKESGEIIWRDNSPGENILTGQWSSPLVIDQGDRPQVVVAQGDGWLRSFDALSGNVIWKFDINFKASRLEFGGRGTKNDCSATPVLYDGRIYVASGQQAEHGEGVGRLVCIDPMKTGDISSELAVDADGHLLSDNRIQMVDSSKGQRAISNPNSGLVWEYVQSDRNGNGKIDFEEQFHRTLSNVAIKNDLLFVTDFSGLTHCLNAKSGKLHWTYDTLAANYASPLIVGDKVYIADEDGDIAIFRLSADPLIAMPDGNVPSVEINMGNSVYCSPVYANGTLYIANRDHLFAIQDQGDQAAGYWPQWRGARRNNISSDWELLQEWPEGGPPLKWRTDGIGAGIASVAVAAGAIYTLGSAGEHENVVALDEATGKLCWRSPIGPAINDAPLMRWLSQRTPTVDGDRLYVTTNQSDLICLQTTDGKELWRKHYIEEFGTLKRSWGFVDYPLVDGDRVICIPGGKEASVVALNKFTGELIWKCLLDPPEAGSYPAAVLAVLAGEWQIVAILNDSLIGVRAADGKLLWRHAIRGLGWINTLNPIVVDDVVILPGGRSAAEMVVLAIKRKGLEFTASEVSRAKLNADHFQDSTVLLGAHLFTAAYGALPMCINWHNGQSMWGPVRTPGTGKVAVTYADQRLYWLFANGSMRLSEATHEGYRERGHFSLPDHIPAIGATFPVITAGRMYIRDNDHLFSYDVRAGNDAKAARPRVNQLSVTDVVSSDGQLRSQAKNNQPDAIFVPTPHDVVAKMLELAEVKAADVLLDLGSGDGRIVIAAAKNYGAKAVGIELDRSLVEQARENIKQAGVGELVKVEHADIFQQNLANADVITLYLPPNLMDRLLPQLEKMKPGARIVSHYFKFTGIPPDKSMKCDSRDDGDSHEIYLWTVPLRKPAP